MEKSTIIIRIPEPCHEDWNKMLPDEKGKFCNSCNKSVFDFSNKTDSQIKDILMAHKDQKVCGHFKKSQVDRPLNLTIDLNNLPKNMSVTKMFTIALFICFGTLLFSCTDNFGKTVGEISVVEPVINKNSENEIPEEMMVGQMIASPPDSLNHVQMIEPLKDIETIDGEIKSVSYTHVSGGVSMQHVVVNEKIIEPLPIDSPIIETPLVEDMIVGAMVWNEPSKDIIENVADTLKPTETFTVDKAPQDKFVNNITSDFVVYPNPTKGEFTIKYDVKKRTDILVEIVDINGVILQTVVNIQEQHTGKYQVPVNMSNLNNGIYFVNLTNEGKRRTQKIILEK